MGDPQGFIKERRKEAGNRPIDERIKDFSEVEQVLNTEDRMKQASRCMDCGVPFCHWACPISNLIPEWQDALFKGNWKLAVDILHSTNPLPEITGRVCPALCEHSCVLGINNDAVTIRENEVAIIEKAFAEGYIKPILPQKRTGKKVAIIGSGPAGLACADFLNKRGHNVSVFEKDAEIGGLMRYGLPDFKLLKSILDRRISIYKKEEIEFFPNSNVGENISINEILNSYDAVCLAIGSMKARDLKIENRDLEGIHFAMEFLKQQNILNSGKTINEKIISAKNKNVVVIGGGDTGSDCVGTAIRQGALSVTQIEILPKPAEKRMDENPWPQFKKVLKTSTSHQEGCERIWSVESKKFIGENGKISRLEVVEVDWKQENNQFIKIEKPETLKTLNCDLVLIAMGFEHLIHEGLCNSLNLNFDKRGNIETNSEYETNVSKIFAAGDAHIGQSLIVTAIFEGRKAGEKIDEFLKNNL